MMKKAGTKTDWASLTMAHESKAVISVRHNSTPYCLCFNSLQELKQALDSKRVSVKKWAVAVPRSLCILKSLILPASDMAEVAKMLQFELPSLVPLPPSEVICGCTPLNRQGNMLRVLVCILKPNTLNRYLEPYESIGIQPRRITLDSLAIQNWFNGAEDATSDAKISVFVEGNRCVVLTSINGDLHKINEMHLPGADATISLREVIQEILCQQDQLPPSLSKRTVILLAGTREYISEIEKRLRFILDKATSVKVRVVESPQIACCHEGNEGTRRDNLGYESAVATGLLELAANTKLPFSNLLPREYFKRTQKKVLLRNYLLTVVLSLVLILLLWLSFITMNWRIEKASRMIELQIAPIEHVASSVDSKRQLVKAVQDQVSNRGQITQIYDELYRYTPKTISISELRFVSRHNGAHIEIKGQADVLSNAFEYVSAMSEADLLDEIQIIDAQQIPRPGGSVVEFKADCVIRND